jgi:G3E family GTPase
MGKKIRRKCTVDSSHRSKHGSRNLAKNCTNNQIQFCEIVIVTVCALAIKQQYNREERARKKVHTRVVAESFSAQKIQKESLLDGKLLQLFEISPRTLQEKQDLMQF